MKPVRGIGGSSAACCLDKHPYRGRVDMYCECLGMPRPRPESFELWFGKAAEPLLREAYAKVTGFLVAEVPDCELWSGKAEPLRKAYPWLDGTPDGFAMHGDSIRNGVELKVAHPMMWKEWGTEDLQVPIAYYCQCQHYMKLTGLDRWDLCVSIGTMFQIHKLTRDDEFINEMLMPAEEAAWKDILRLAELKDTNPAAFAEMMCEVAKRDEAAKAHIAQTVWPRAQREPEVCPVEHLQLLADLFRVNVEYRASEGNLEELKNKVKLVIQDRKGISCQFGRVEWRNHGKGRALYVLPNEENRA